MKQYIFLFVLLFVFSQNTARGQSEKPNILWIVSEDNIPMLGAYGDTFATTPNLDKFAERSILYKMLFPQRLFVLRPEIR